MLKLLLVCLASYALPLSYADVTHSVGIARDAKDQTLRYVEHHQYLPSGEHLVKYYNPQGTILVSKAITYPGLPQHPQIDQTDFTKDLRIQTTNADGSVRVVRNQAGSSDSFDLPLDAGTIVDAGFDNFIRSHWQNFNLGEPQLFKLAVAGEDSLLKVTITKEEISGENTLFAIAPKNFFIRLLVPELQLEYGADRSLRKFKGLTNLNLPANQNRNVTVTFSRYTSSEALDKPMTEWIPDQ